ncbi:MAG: flavodoxin family protein [Phocaeicola dorei]|nr:flavodoxin family protein [Phocaeicola dorei]
MAAILNTNGIETEFYWVGNRPLSGCVACGACSQNGRCYMNDTVNEFLDKAKDFDGFVFGSPVHFAAMTGTMTSFMDRAFFCARTRKEFGGKVAAAVTSCRRSGSTTTLDQLNKYFIHGGMPVVPSQYWPMVYGNTPDEVRQDAEGLQIMRTLAQNMTWMLCCIEAGHQMGITYPEREPRVSTNFIR